jgi:hypothetical protein
MNSLKTEKIQGSVFLGVYQYDHFEGGQCSNTWFQLVSATTEE